MRFGTVIRIKRQLVVPLLNSGKSQNRNLAGSVAKLPQPELPHRLETRDSFADLRDFLGIKLQHHVAELEHPLLSRKVWVYRDEIGVGDLNLAPPKCADGQTVPSEKLNRHERDLRDLRPHPFHRVLDEKHREEVRVVLVETC